MAKLTDARVVTLKGFFNSGDQPTESNFADLIQYIQEGIEEHNHDGTGDGDGVASVGITAITGAGVDVPDDWYIGIGAALERIVFDAAGDVAVMGANLGIGTLVPGALVDVNRTGSGIVVRATTDQTDGTAVFQLVNGNAQSVLIAYANHVVQIGNGAVTLAAAGDFGIGVSPSYKLDVADNVGGGFVANFFNDGDNINRGGIQIKGGADAGATAGETYYVYALDGDGDVTGTIKTVAGVFQVADVSDRARKTHIKDTGVVGLDIVKALRVRDYNWKEAPDGAVMTSFVAQEAREVFPDMVGEGLDGTLMTSRAILIPILTKAIQELDARLSTLEAK